MLGIFGKSVSTDKNKINTALERSVVEVISKEELERELGKGKKLRIKLGIDPTSPNIHLGRAVQLLKLKDFQDLGHTIVFIIGDATGVVGDTSDKESERPMLSHDEVRSNAQTYFEQAGMVLDMSLVEKRYNSEWLNELTYKEIGEHADQFSVSDFIARENIKRRLDNGKRVSLREVLYPLMQGYDSVAVKADVEIGGTDQRFNLLAGRKLQEHGGQKPQHVLTTELISGIDGRKMSSSWGNTINLTTSPSDMYGKVMSIKDETIISYFTAVTRVSLSEVKDIEKSLKEGSNPRDSKMRLAKEIVSIFHGDESARRAEDDFTKTFQKKETPSDMPQVFVKKGTTLSEALKDNISSKSELRRLVKDGAVSVIGGDIVTEFEYLITKDTTFKIGKRKFIEVKIT
tara:strand:+ start:8071 stop:9276 length:1206 start_codon:yes stop_codon:yes gene_type:complete